MEREDFLATLQHSGVQLRDSFRGVSVDWLSCICDGIPYGDPAGKLTIDVVYELMCCFGLANALKPNVSNLRLVAAPGVNGFRFPLKPGRKEAFAFFRFEYEDTSYDLCCGVAIPVVDEPPEAPDITLEEHRSILPDSSRRHGAPRALWDAKYHKGAASKSDFQQIQSWGRIFNLPPYAPGDLLARLMPTSFQVSGILTNAPVIQFNRGQMLESRCSVLFNYSGNYTTPPTPTRIEHEAVT